MPEPVATTSNGGPLVTLLSPSPSKKSSKSSKKPSPSASESEKPAITLSQGAFEVDAGAQLYLSGVYPTGEGAVLDIAQRVGTGAWEEFPVDVNRSEAHTSELQSLMRISYAVFCLKNKTTQHQ